MATASTDLVLVQLVSHVQRLVDSSSNSVGRLEVGRVSTRCNSAPQTHAVRRALVTCYDDGTERCSEPNVPVPDWRRGV